VTAVRPDADALRALASSVAGYVHQIKAVIESICGARFVDDHPEPTGSNVEIADAARMNALAPSAQRPIGSTPGSWPSLGGAT
jgi:hypothetical protein